MDWVSTPGKTGANSLDIIKMVIEMATGNYMILKVGCSRRLGNKGRLQVELFI
jgi:hypothetical protein